jgi:serine O-acetyltransferase
VNSDFSEISVRISGVYKEIAKTHCSSNSYSLGNVKLKTIELIHLIRRTICHSTFTRRNDRRTGVALEGHESPPKAYPRHSTGVE